MALQENDEDTAAEVNAIVSACDRFPLKGIHGEGNRNRLRAMVLLLRYSGLRIRDAATSLIADLPRRRVTIGGDKGYDTRGFVATLRQLDATPHVALKKNSRTLDRRTTRHAGYDISQRTPGNGSKKSSAG